MKVFITGGTGSLGEALLEHFSTRDVETTVFSRDEVKQGLQKRRYPHTRFILGDCRDSGWLATVMRGHDVVIHAAAYKQVPAAEVNSYQATEVNVFGSIAVARAAVASGVGQVIGVSTDKACAPVNCYGATKMLMEKLFQEAGTWSPTHFNLVRYGNVLGSRGSVVPFFRAQAAKGNILTVTDPNMTRFWLTLQEAKELILDAMCEGESGTILIPKCRASTMAVLAHAVAPRCEIKVIGTRPGEKTHEQLVHSAEAMHTLDIGKYYRIYPATSGISSNLPEGFTYTSDTAIQYTVEELQEIVKDA
jgi:FlaA1/EpsC-like NDP-sugar epimerase